MKPLALIAAGALIFAGALLRGWTVASATERLPLHGEAFIAGKTLIDPPPSEPQTNVYLSIEGAAAIEMYQRMTGPETEDLCLPDRTMKQAGSLACFVAKNRSEASCNFSIDLEVGRLEEGNPC